MDRVVGALGAAVLIIALSCIVGLFMAWPLMLLWNGCLIDAVPGVKEIAWFQAWGILVVCNMLFKPVSK